MVSGFFGRVATGFFGAVDRPAPDEPGAEPYQNRTCDETDSNEKGGRDIVGQALSRLARAKCLARRAEADIAGNHCGMKKANRKRAPAENG
jgi:hypothetical protein